MHFYRISSLFALLILFEGLLAVPSLHAVTYPEQPPKTDFFVDQARLISAEDANELNKTALALLQEEQVALIIVTITSLKSHYASQMTIESYAQALFDEWGIGDDERNYGMLLLISKEDRKARIELGADWGHKYDRDAKRVMDTLIIPKFKAGNFSMGILEGVRGMNAMARGLKLPKPTSPWWILPLTIGLIVLIICVIVSLFKNGKAGWGWALIAALAVIIFFILRAAASSSGSGGAFGGGSSGGGGASGSW
ncbi:TPM domain-containing protein [Oligoflexia bacterium]|nr:TPM domain-containing protein [Oligoflexia bacterium]